MKLNVSITYSDIAVKSLLLITLLFSGTLCVNAYTRYWHQKSTLYDRLSLDPGDIVFFGNSITDGGEFDEMFQNQRVKNRGISGDVVAGLRKRIRQATNNNPSKIFILIGINDIANGRTPQQIAADYNCLLQEIRKITPETKIYIQSVMPIDNSFKVFTRLNGKEKLITELNEKIKEVASYNNAEYIDLWPALADPKTGKLKKQYTNDGLHLLGAGYAAWADAIREKVNN